jgi:hypothetical protein
MIPYERSLVERLRNKRFALLGVNCDRRRDAADRLMLEQRMSWRSWWDGTGSISDTWRVEFLPAIFVLDAEGVIRYKDVIDEHRLDEAVDRLLNELQGAKSS